MASVCVDEGAKPQAPMRQHTANSSQSSSGSSDRPAYRLFPVIDSTQPGSTPRLAERRRSALLDGGAGVTKKSIASRRGKKINISIRKAAKAAAALRSPTTPRSASPSIYTVQRERSSDHGRSDSAQEDADSVQQLPPIRTESEPLMTWASKQAVMHPLNIKGLSSASSDSSIKAANLRRSPSAASAKVSEQAPAAPSPISKSAAFQHKRQSSSVSTMASICDGAILELPSLNARASTAAGSDMRVRTVMVSAPSVRRLGPPPITVVTLPDGDVEKPQPLFTPGVGSRARSSPIDVQSPTTANDVSEEKTPKPTATSFFDIKKPETAGPAATPQSIYVTPTETDSSSSLPRLRDRDTLRVLINGTPSPSPLEAPRADTVPNKQLPNVPTSMSGGLQPMQTPTRANLMRLLAEVSKQSEALHARYASLRADRLKLTVNIAGLLREGKVGQETTHALLDQHLSLNAINSSMDICFAKLKSLASQKDEAIVQLSALADARAVTNVKVEAAQALLVAQMSAAATRLANPTVASPVRPAPTPMPKADGVDSARTAIHVPQALSSQPPTPTTEKPKEAIQTSGLAATTASTGVKAKNLRVEVVNITRSPSAASRRAPPSPAAVSPPGSDSWPAELEAPLVSPVTPAGPVTLPKTTFNPAASATATAASATKRTPTPTARPNPVATAAVAPPAPAPASAKPPTPKIGSSKRIPRRRTDEPLPPLPPLSAYVPQHTAAPTGPAPRRAPPPPPSSISSSQRHRRAVPDEDSMASLSTASGSSVSSSDEVATPRSSLDADGGDGLGPLLAIRAAPRDLRAARKPAVPLAPLQVMSTEAHAFSQFCEGLFAYKV